MSSCCRLGKAVLNRQIVGVQNSKVITPSSYHRADQVKYSREIIIKLAENSQILPNKRTATQTGRSAPPSDNSYFVTSMCLGINSCARSNPLLQGSETGCPGFPNFNLSSSRERVQFVTNTRELDIRNGP